MYSAVLHILLEVSSFYYYKYSLLVFCLLYIISHKYKHISIINSAIEMSQWLSVFPATAEIRFLSQHQWGSSQLFAILILGDPSLFWSLCPPGVNVLQYLHMHRQTLIHIKFKNLFFKLFI